MEGPILVDGALLGLCVLESTVGIDVVGLTLGLFEGRMEGSEVVGEFDSVGLRPLGAGEGILEGLGELVGVLDGDFDGFTLGTDEGETLGVLDGLDDILGFGDFVGIALGDTEGLEDLVGFLLGLILG